VNINVPEWARDHFWEEPPPHSEEFWSFGRHKPPCAPGDPLTFRFDGWVVASAVVSRIEPPHVSVCEGTGRFGGGWKVFWHPHSFKDLRPEPSGEPSLFDAIVGGKARP
jgi:hypothetical protein